MKYHRPPNITGYSHCSWLPSRNTLLKTLHTGTWRNQADTYLDKSYLMVCNSFCNVEGIVHATRGQSNHQCYCAMKPESQLQLSWQDKPTGGIVAFKYFGSNQPLSDWTQYILYKVELMLGTIINTKKLGLKRP